MNGQSIAGKILSELSGAFRRAFSELETKMSGKSPGAEGELGSTLGDAGGKIARDPSRSKVGRARKRGFRGHRGRERGRWRG